MIYVHTKCFYEPYLVIRCGNARQQRGADIMEFHFPVTRFVTVTAYRNNTVSVAPFDGSSNVFSAAFNFYIFASTDHRAQDPVQPESARLQDQKVSLLRRNNTRREFLATLRFWSRF